MSDPITVAGLALAIAAPLDLCLKDVIALCQSQRNIDQELDAMIVAFNGLWIKTDAQLEALSAI
ncbi:hypothetical protein PHISP_03547 [Aspergillus sp. HF37]|nr:hypothetical protein PHISP_03547 [Aspergillus sp. HF37]